MQQQQQQQQQQQLSPQQAVDQPRQIKVVGGEVASDEILPGAKQRCFGKHDDTMTNCQSCLVWIKDQCVALTPSKQVEPSVGVPAQTAVTAVEPPSVADLHQKLNGGGA